METRVEKQLDTNWKGSDIHPFGNHLHIPYCTFHIFVGCQ